MNKYQFRAIRNSFQRDIIYSKGTGYNNDLLDFPIMRKKIEDVRIWGKPVSKYYYDLEYELTKNGNVYKYHYVDYGKAFPICIVTKNDIIIYWHNYGHTDGWHLLTEVYHGYGTGRRSGCWTWQSETDFDCKECGFTASWQKKDFKSDWLFQLKTDYQKKMFEKTGESYVDKRIVSKEKAEELAAKESYWT